MDVIVQMRRDAGAALQILRRLFGNQKVESESIVMHGLRSYGPALQRRVPNDLNRLVRLRDGNRTDASHLIIRRRERNMQGYKTEQRRSAPKGRPLSFKIR